MQDNANTSRLMSIGEASEYLGVSIDTLRRWEKKKRIEPLRSPGGHRYFSKDDLDALFGKRYTRDEETSRRTNEELGRFETQEVINPPTDILETPPVETMPIATSVTPPINTENQQKPPEEPVNSEISAPQPVNTEWHEHPIKSILEPVSTEAKPTEEVKQPESSGNTFTLPNISMIQKDEESKLLTEEEIEKRVNSILKTDNKSKNKANIILVIFSSLILITDIVLLYLWAMSAKIVSPIP